MTSVAVRSRPEGSGWQLFVDGEDISNSVTACHIQITTRGAVVQLVIPAHDFDLGLEDAEVRECQPSTST